MSKKKAAAEKTPKVAKTPKAAKAPHARKNEGPLMTFAIRLSPEESRAIHKAAGPRGASRFARNVLAAAAKGDVDLFLAALMSAREAVASAAE